MKGPDFVVAVFIILILGGICGWNYYRGSAVSTPQLTTLSHDNQTVVVVTSNINTIRMGRSDLQIPAQGQGPPPLEGEAPAPTQPPRQVERWVVIAELVVGEPIQFIFIGGDNPGLEATKMFTELTHDVFGMEDK